MKKYTAGRAWGAAKGYSFREGGGATLPGGRTEGEGLWRGAGVLLAGQRAKDGQAEGSRTRQGCCGQQAGGLTLSPGMRVGIFECRADHTC